MGYGRTRKVRSYNKKYQKNYRCSNFVRFYFLKRFRSMAPMYYRNAKAAILVFDLSQEDSFEKAKEWLEDLRNHVEPDIVLAIVGNKLDADSAFDFNIAKQYADSIGAIAHKTSALTGQGVDEVFTDVARRLLQKHMEQRRRQADDGAADFNSGLGGNGGNGRLRVERERGGKQQAKGGCC
jgi:GTPase SAR1 family protein